MKKDFTIMLPLPTHDMDFSNQCIQHLLKNSDFPIIVIDEQGKDEDYIHDKRLSIIHTNSKHRPSLVTIWNTCIKKCPTDYVIVATWRQRPTPQHFKLIEEKLKDGYGMVGFEGLHLFGFNKYLTTVIGFFDEGFTKGTYEDTDWFNRLFAHNIAMYQGDIEEERMSHGKYVHSLWLEDAHKNKKYYETKWIEDAKNHQLIQLKEEVNIADRTFFKNTKPITYRPWSDSVFNPTLEKFYDVYITYVNKIHK